MGIVIEVEKLVKQFKTARAVDNISFTVGRGECFGLLGPNGAGKTTTVNMLSTLLKPTSGRALIAGYDVGTQKNQVRASIGMVFQEPALDSKLTGKENLEFHAMMYGIAPRSYKKSISELLDLVELSEKADTLVQNYSGGMKRRLEIARGLIQKPKVLFLDEPTLGLDSQTRRRIWDYIKGLLSEKNISIILTTHYMEEADFLCDRIAIIDSGRIIALGTPKELKDSQGGDVLTLEVESASGTFTKALSAMAGIRSIKEYQECQKCLTVTLERAETKIPDVLRMAQEFSVRVLSVNVHKISLEDVFLNYTGRTIKNTEEREKVW